MLLTTLYIVFVVIVFVQCVFYIGIFSKVLTNSTRHQNSKNIPVSIVICAKDEAENLNHTLPHLAKQVYPTFEIILVNDHSSDTTLSIFKTFKKQYDNLDVTIVDLNNEKNKSNKKKALTMGITHAKYEHLLLTDADCKPASENWILEISKLFTSEKTIVLGYGAYEKVQGSWLNKLIRFETLLTAVQYFSYTKLGIPYMGVGRNIAYTKTNFTKTNGFSKHQHIRSGDDDLFINAIANKENTAICMRPESFTISKPHTHFKKWIKQKRRHITTASSYKPLHKAMLGLFFMSQFLFWFLAISLCISGFNQSGFLLLFLFRIIMLYAVIGFSAKKLEEKDLILFIPFLELFLIVIQWYIFIKNLIKTPTEW